MREDNVQEAQSKPPAAKACKYPAVAPIGSKSQGADNEFERYSGAGVSMAAAVQARVVDSVNSRRRLIKVPKRVVLVQRSAALWFDQFRQFGKSC